MTTVTSSSSLMDELVVSLKPKLPLRLPITIRNNSVGVCDVVLTFKQGDQELNSVGISVRPGKIISIKNQYFGTEILGLKYREGIPIDVYWKTSNANVVMSYEFDDTQWQYVESVEL